jgi:DNA repair protein RadD
MVGRGLRTHHGKQDCLILDFGENIKRHGPIDSPEYGKKSRKQDRKGGKTSGGDGSKICPNCDEVVAANTRQCECGFIFPPTHQEESSQEQILAKPERWRVLEMTMQRWSKKNAKEWKPDTLRVNYLVIPDDGTEAGEINLQEQTISEWVCLEHDGWAFVKAKKWLAEYTRAKLEDMQIESNIGAAIDLFSRGAFAETKTITTMKDGRFQKIISRELGQRPESWQEPLEPVGYNEWGDPIYDDDPLSETSGLEDAPF